MRIIDTHTHGYFPQFNFCREKIHHECLKAGVKYQIQIGCDEVSTLAALQLAKENKDMFASLGLHPCDALNFGAKKKNNLKGFENYQPRAHNLAELFVFFERIFLENSENFVAVGETGLDFYHNYSEDLCEAQKESFLLHLQFARKHKLPLIIHSRQATKELLKFFRENNMKEDPGVIHCFSEGQREAQIYTEEYGFMLGIGGVATYKNAESIRQAILSTDIKYLMTETDSPFLPPQEFRKKHKINNSSAITEVIELIADIKKMSVKKCAEILYRNAANFFGI